jgi:hypothetical protein
MYLLFLLPAQGTPPESATKCRPHPVMEALMNCGGVPAPPDVYLQACVVNPFGFAFVGAGFKPARTEDQE